MVEYSDVDLIHKDYQKEKQTDEAIINQVPANVKVMAVGAAGLILYFFGLQNGEWKKALLFVGILLGGIYMWATSQQHTGEKEMTDLQLRTLLWKQLRYYQLNPFGSHYVIPDGEIRILPSVARWTVADSAKYRTYSVGILKRNNLFDYFGIDVDIFSGDIVKVAEGYFTGKERPHIKYIESEDVARKKRYEKAVDKKGGGES